MLAAARHQEILTRLECYGAVRTTELASEFSVTEETIRRDLDKLDHKHKLVRTHGGAISLDSSRKDLPQSQRENVQLAEKVAIAKAAVPFINDHETILLDASSSALQLALALPKNRSLRVVTYALSVLQALSHRSDLELILLGGTYDPVGARFTGVLTDEALNFLKIDRFFFSAKGFDAQRGISEADSAQAKLKRQILRQALWSCALIDHTKFGVLAPHIFAKTNEFDVLVSDSNSESYLQKNLSDPPFKLKFAPLE